MKRFYTSNKILGYLKLFTFFQLGQIYTALDSDFVNLTTLVVHYSIHIVVHLVPPFTLSNTEEII